MVLHRIKLTANKRCQEVREILRTNGHPCPESGSAGHARKTISPASPRQGGGGYPPTTVGFNVPNYIRYQIQLSSKSIRAGNRSRIYLFTAIPTTNVLQKA